MRVPEVEVKYERDLNIASGDDVLRIFARRRGTRRWLKFVAVATKMEPIPYLIEHAQELGETWLRLEESRGCGQVPELRA